MSLGTEMRGPTRSGFTLTEMMVVVVIMTMLSMFTFPKFAVLQERSRLTSARQEIEAAIATARAAAIQKGRSAYFRMVNNHLQVQVASPVGGPTTVIPLTPLDSVYRVTVSPADTLITFDMRGFANPRLGATSVYRIIGPTRRDSVCVTTAGQIMPRGCSL